MVERFKKVLGLDKIKKSEYNKVKVKDATKNRTLCGFLLLH